MIIIFHYISNISSYIRQIKCDAKVRTFKELKEKASNLLE